LENNHFFSDCSVKTKRTRSTRKSNVKNKSKQRLQLINRLSDNSEKDTNKEESIQDTDLINILCDETFTLNPSELMNDSKVFNEDNIQILQCQKDMHIDLILDQEKTSDTRFKEFMVSYKLLIAPFTKHSKNNIECNDLHFETIHINEREFVLLDKHPTIKNNMRANLLYWLLDICSWHMFRRDTYFRSVSIIDQYLSNSSNLQKDRLQLLGVTALMLACKYEVIIFINRF